MKDAATAPRLAAALVCGEILNNDRPKPSSPINGAATAFDWDAWLPEYRGGKGRDERLAESASPLRSMLHSADLAERVAAAVPLVAMGDDKDAPAVLKEAAATAADQRIKIAAAIKWLPTDARLELCICWRLTPTATRTCLHRSPSDWPKHQARR